MIEEILFCGPRARALKGSPATKSRLMLSGPSLLPEGDILTGRLVFV